MLGDFWKGFGGKLADRWVAALLSPAFLFWTGALIAWLWGHQSATIRNQGWHAGLVAWAKDLQGLPGLVQGGYVALLLIVITLSGLILQQASFPVVRLLEGYWPRWLDGVAQRRRDRLSQRINADTTQLRALVAASPNSLSARQVAERGRLESRRRRAPAAATSRMPTRLGNTLRAAEVRVQSRYGLDPIICWPRLWLLLPNTAREEVAAAYAALLLSAQVLLCGALFTVWGIWAWWAPLLGLLTAIGSYLRMLRAATIVADLVESCYDVHRALLYASLRWPPPANPQAERREGARLTAYLNAGSRQPTPVFTGSGSENSSVNPPGVNHVSSLAEVRTVGTVFRGGE